MPNLFAPQVLKTAEEGEGDMEVLDAQFEMAKMWAQIGDKVSGGWRKRKEWQKTDTKGTTNQIKPVRATPLFCRCHNNAVDVCMYAHI